MTENIQQIISTIRSKAVGFHDQLKISKEKNQQLEAEISSLKSEIQALKESVEIYKAEFTNLHAELTKAKEEAVTTSSESDSVNRDEEIDALVKEIEYCIHQLKK
jgi:molecular chaperone GrpE (heat shock protein)